MSRIGRSVAAVVLTAFLVLAIAPSPVAAELEMALTFDDLPANSTRDDLAVHAAVTDGLIGALAEADVTAAGFVNEIKLEEEGAVAPARVELLRSWLAAGHELGNHSYSHPSLFSTPLEDFQRDVLAGERVLRPLLAEHGATPRYFRHPFLNTGPSVEVRDAFVAFLTDRGYRVAPVTIDNHEWIYARAYDHALDEGDVELSQRIGAEYLSYMDQVVAYYEAQSTAFLGRQVKQILLLHANRLNADHLPELLAALRARGYRFISLDQALTDPAYALPDSYAGRGGITWLHRWALTAGKRGDFFAGEPPAPDWIRRAARLAD